MDANRDQTQGPGDIGANVDKQVQQGTWKPTWDREQGLLFFYGVGGRKLIFHVSLWITVSSQSLGRTPPLL